MPTVTISGSAVDRALAAAKAHAQCRTITRGPGSVTVACTGAWATAAASTAAVSDTVVRLTLADVSPEVEVSTDAVTPVGGGDHAAVVAPAVLLLLPCWIPGATHYPRAPCEVAGHGGLVLVVFPGAAERDRAQRLAAASLGWGIMPSVMRLVVENVSADDVAGVLAPWRECQHTSAKITADGVQTTRPSLPLIHFAAESRREGTPSAAAITCDRLLHFDVATAVTAAYPRARPTLITADEIRWPRREPQTAAVWALPAAPAMPPQCCIVRTDALSVADPNRIDVVAVAHYGPRDAIRTCVARFGTEGHRDRLVAVASRTVEAALVPSTSRVYAQMPQPTIRWAPPHYTPRNSHGASPIVAIDSVYTRMKDDAFQVDFADDGTPAALSIYIATPLTAEDLEAPFMASPVVQQALSRGVSSNLDGQKKDMIDNTQGYSLSFVHSRGVGRRAVRVRVPVDRTTLAPRYDEAAVSLEEGVVLDDELSNEMFAAWQKGELSVGPAVDATLHSMMRIMDASTSPVPPGPRPGGPQLGFDISTAGRGRGRFYKITPMVIPGQQQRRAARVDLPRFYAPVMAAALQRALGGVVPVLEQSEPSGGAALVVRALLQSPYLTPELRAVLESDAGQRMSVADASRVAAVVNGGEQVKDLDTLLQAAGGPSFDLPTLAFQPLIPPQVESYLPTQAEVAADLAAHVPLVGPRQTFAVRGTSPLRKAGDLLAQYVLLLDMHGGQLPGPQEVRAALEEHLATYFEMSRATDAHDLAVHPARAWLDRRVAPTDRVTLHRGVVTAGPRPSTDHAHVFVPSLGVALRCAADDAARAPLQEVCVVVRALPRAPVVIPEGAALEMCGTAFGFSPGQSPAQYVVRPQLTDDGEPLVGADCGRPVVVECRAVAFGAAHRTLMPLLSPQHQANLAGLLGDVDASPMAVAVAEARPEGSPAAVAISRPQLTQ